MQLPSEFSPFIEKRGFLLSGRGGYPPPSPLSGPTTKKKLFFMRVFPKIALFFGRYSSKNTNRQTLT